MDQIFWDELAEFNEDYYDYLVTRIQEKDHAIPERIGEHIPESLRAKIYEETSKDVLRDGGIHQEIFQENEKEICECGKEINIHDSYVLDNNTGRQIKCKHQ